MESSANFDYYKTAAQVEPELGSQLQLGKYKRYA